MAVDVVVADVVVVVVGGVQVQTAQALEILADWAKVWPVAGLVWFNAPADWAKSGHEGL